jgi:steroid 5-alpha reductase family enzyme
MSVWSCLAVLKKRSDLADQAWGLGFVVIAVLALLSNQAYGSFLVILALVTIWGFRLFWHIRRRHKKSEEDQRYQELVDKKKSRFREVYLKVFMLQGFFMLIVALPIITAGYLNNGWLEFGAINGLGLIVWVTGFLFESIGDKQLGNFISKPENKGKIMTEGLWYYTRHPNYFGEITMWWGILLLAYPGEIAGPWLVAIAGPSLITYLIVFVSGIPLLEKRYLANEEYKKYAKSTSMLIPWFKK